MKKSIWIILFHVLYMNLIISCVEKADLDQKEEYSTSEYFENMPLEILNLSALKISATDTIITSEMACNVAKLANIYNCIQTKSTVVKEVDDVIIINDSNNNPLFYAIN